MRARLSLRFVAALAPFVAMPVPSHADTGTAELLLSGQSTLTSVPMGDTTVTTSATSGTVTTIRSSGGPFTEGVSGTVQCARFSKKSPTGFELEADCAATFSPDDTLSLLFKRRTGDVVAGSSGEGVLQITGVSGRFSGLTGQCKYRVENFPGNWNVTMSKCQWSN